MNLVVFPKQLHNQVGLDLIILDENATAADLLAAMEPYSDETTITKPYLPQRRGKCKGCYDNCCVRSWIAPDLPSILELKRIDGLSWTGLTARYFDQAAYNQGVLRFKSRPCVFLRHELCQVYQARPAICRFFVCSPMTPELEDLGHRVIGLGLAALIQAWQLLGLWPDIPVEKKIPLIEQWHDHTDDFYDQEFLRFYLHSVKWAAERELGDFSYDQIRLQEICTPEQWRLLTRQ